MKRSLSLLMAVCLLLSSAACASSEALDRMDRMRDVLLDIREQLEKLPPDVFQPEPEPEEIHAAVCIAEDSDYQRQTKRGTLTVGMTREAGSFDPCSSSFAAGMYLVYDSLFRMDAQGEVQGQLAEEWEYQDETHLYIRIRDAVFSNGDPVTAEDCLWSLQRFAESGSRWSILFDFIDFNESKTISDTELVLATKAGFGPGIRYLASYFSSVLDKSYVSSAEDGACPEQPVGSGPYVFVPGEDDSVYTFALREDLEGDEPLPEAETVHIRIYADSASMMNDYENGSLDMAFETDTLDTNRLLAGEISDTSYVIQENRDICSLVLSENTEAFDDIRVRRAIAMSIDWTSIRKAALGALGAQADSVLPEGVQYKESFGFSEYDPEAAKVLLEEAGFDSVQRFVFVVPDSDAYIQTARAIQRDLHAVGINVNLRIFRREKADECYRSGDTDLAFHFLDFPALDPDQLLGDCAAWSEYPTFRIAEEPMPTYLEIGRWSDSDAIREECYHRAQSWMYESLRYIPYAELYSCYCCRPYIDPDFWCDSVGMPDLRSVSFSGT